MNDAATDATDTTDAGWEERSAELWAAIDTYGEDDFRARIGKLAAELPPDHPAGLFERAAAFDSTGRSDLAVPLYRQALDRGLAGERRRRAVIQLASSLRNLGRAPEGVALLTAERDAGSDHLNDAVTVFLALALADTGREREALSLALTALAGHLPRYQRSAANYARLLVEPNPTG
ncbi:tetratricopeptide repeat protein [Streptomyces sp. NPDC006733]|uniref:tetratricopeptide repeat protein n=1 Tax=Streptomyces sp. NPDC006733 TaxID=3155460 RepID=UPI0033FBADA8